MSSVVKVSHKQMQQKRIFVQIFLGIFFFMQIYFQLWPNPR